NAGGDARLQVVFYDATDASVGSITTAPVNAAAYTLASASGTVPASAVSAAARVLNDQFATNTVSCKHVTLNRGTVPLVEPPPGRPSRESIHVWDGTLRPTVTASDGAAARLLPKGVLHG